MKVIAEASSIPRSLNIFSVTVREIIGHTFDNITRLFPEISGRIRSAVLLICITLWLSISSSAVCLFATYVQTRLFEMRDANLIDVGFTSAATALTYSFLFVSYLSRLLSRLDPLGEIVLFRWLTHS